MPALCTPATVVADQHRRITASVLEHPRLLATRQAGADGIGHLSRQAGVEWPLADIDHPHLRRPGVAGALVQTQVAVAPGTGMSEGFQCRRRRTEQHRNTELFAAHQRQVTGMVTHAVVLLVRAIVFLVDHNQAGSGQRGEYRRSEEHTSELQSLMRSSYAVLC